MRPFILARHSSSRSIHESASTIAARPSLKDVRRAGRWAFVSIPKDADLPCIVHFWHRRNLAVVDVAAMLGHELGHIADGGPKDWLLGPDAEEERADEFAAAVREVIDFLLREGVLSLGSG